MKLASCAEKAMNVLYRNGFEAYAVGGCVRDRLLGKEPSDWDICTDALPEQIINVFSDYTTYGAGIKHGTVGVVIDGNTVEITTYRVDGEYIGHRQPAEVKFVRNLHDDLSRRDFTINALAYSESSGLIDCYGGEKDLHDGIIRAINNPSQRFDEDALRILRAVRFSAQLGFAIEADTYSAMLRKLPLLEEISAERKLVELTKTLCSENVTQVLIRNREVLAQIIPEIKPCFDFEQRNKHHSFDVWEHIARSVERVPSDFILRMTMLLHDIGKPPCCFADRNGNRHFKGHMAVSAKLADEILSRLRCDKLSHRRIVKLISEHDNRFTAERITVKRFISQYGYQFMRDYLCVRYADTMAQSEYMREEKLDNINKISVITDELEAENACLCIKSLAVNGDDIKNELGLSGRDIGVALHEILVAVIDERIQNSKQEIIGYLRSTR